MILKMANNNSSFQNYTNLDDHTRHTNDILGFKPFTKKCEVDYSSLCFRPFLLECPSQEVRFAFAKILGLTFESFILHGGNVVNVFIRCNKFIIDHEKALIPWAELFRDD